jgi:hypothetical protein
MTPLDAVTYGPNMLSCCSVHGAERLQGLNRRWTGSGTPTWNSHDEILAVSMAVSCTMIGGQPLSHMIV